MVRASAGLAVRVLPEPERSLVLRVERRVPVVLAAQAGKKPVARAAESAEQ
jgi:hypothetical protein